MVFRSRAYHEYGFQELIDPRQILGIVFLPLLLLKVEVFLVHIGVQQTPNDLINGEKPHLNFSFGHTEPNLGNPSLTLLRSARAAEIDSPD